MIIFKELSITFNIFNFKPLIPVKKIFKSCIFTITNIGKIIHSCTKFNKLQIYFGIIGAFILLLCSFLNILILILYLYIMLFTIKSNQWKFPQILIDSPILLLLYVYTIILFFLYTKFLFIYRLSIYSCLALLTTLFGLRLVSTKIIF